MVRHGEADNPRRLIYGRLPGFPLSGRGRAQAAEAAQRLEAMVRAPIAVFASPLERAQQTAAIVREAFGLSEHVVDERLIEPSSGVDGLPRRGKLAELARRAMTPAAWRQAERPSSVARRMQQAVRAALASSPHEIVIVSHQFPIWMARVAFERRIGEPGATLFAASMPWLYIRGRCELASITTFTFEGPSLRSIDYTSCGMPAV
jgi:broad specificity phosphatase PhoE